MKNEIVYSAQKRNFLPGVRYNNPQYFTGPRSDVASVIVIGGWDEIADAYRFSNPDMPVVVLDKPEDLPGYLDRRMRAASPKPSTEEDEDMRFKSGTPEHTAYWAARRGGMTTRQAIAAAEAQKAPVAPEKPVEAPPARGTYDTAPKPSVNADTPDSPDSPDIPDDWRDLPWPRLRALAASVSETPVNSRDDCERAIEAAIERRD